VEALASAPDRTRRDGRIDKPADLTVQFR
jgi:hypothetical protein